MVRTPPPAPSPRAAQRLGDLLAGKILRMGASQASASNMGLVAFHNTCRKTNIFISPTQEKHLRIHNLITYYKGQMNELAKLVWNLPIYLITIIAKTKTNF